MKGYESRSSSSCAACKLLKRRCTPNCVFAPYFHSDECMKFAKVHKVFGASNVSKILIEVPQEHREDTVNSLAFEAEARLRDPVYGCIGDILLLQMKMFDLQHDLAIAKDRLARCAAATVGPGCNREASNHRGVSLLPGHGKSGEPQVRHHVLNQNLNALVPTATATVTTTTSSDVLHATHVVSLPPLPDFSTFNGVNDSFCHNSSSSQLLRRHEIVDDFIQIPYIL
ncbi:putative transcription factor AS2-LOB family [Lupinus albus]|uniref:Putative transcription factor AS2-LOB family n=1 Tax=Lupinus albus TaxID=3870 RepID=A0A6A4NA63_LUPAL|nr:putative transcription factor AS2-LOB family [Lupinus albus]